MRDGLYSGRLDWHSPTNDLTRLLRAKRALGCDVADLTASNPTTAGFAYPEEAIREALARAATQRYTPAALGLPAAREAVAAYYAARAAAVSAADICLACSTSEAYGWLFALLADPGDEVLALTPSYPLFDYLAGLAGIRLRGVPMAHDRDRWAIDPAAIRAALTARTRAILLVSPNNPTGHALGSDEWRVLADIAAQHDLPLIVDEVFADYPLDVAGGRILRHVSELEIPCFILNGLSKIAGLPQMKLGWIAVAGPERFRAEAISRLELIADTHLSVAGPIQHAAADLLAVADHIQPQIQARIRTNLATLRAAGHDIPHLDGGWYAPIRLPADRDDDTTALDLLEQHDILVHPAHLFDYSTPNWLIASLLALPTAIARFTPS